MATYNDIQLIKREFFSMRNGVIADTMRRAGAPYRIVFGLTLPQISEIARAVGSNRKLSETLWNNKTTRESMMLAPMIFPRAEMDKETAQRWLTESPSVEIVDVLCHRLLRHLPFARELAGEIYSEGNDLLRYASLRLLKNLLPQSQTKAEEFARKELERETPTFRLLATQILDEIEFMENQ